MSIEAMKQALEAFEHMCHHTRAKVGYKGEMVGDAMESLRQAIAEAEKQEPVAWRTPNWGHGLEEWAYFDADERPIGANGLTGEPLYTTPPQRKPLTGEQIEFTWMKSMQSTPGTALPIHEFAKAIEAAHGIKE